MLRFTLTLDRASSSATTVDVRTVAFGGATEGVDYQALAPTTITFSAGQIAKSVDVTVNGDTLDEGDYESFYLELTNPTGADFGGGYTGATYIEGRIYDDDGAGIPLPSPTVTATSGSVVEGDAGDVVLHFTVSLDRISATPVSVGTSVNDYTATSPDDYVAVAPATLTFAPGQTIKDVAVTVHGDTLDEGNYELLYLQLDNPSGATLATSFVYGYIYDDDAAGPGQIRFASASQSAGERDGSATIYVDRIGGQSGAVSVHFAVTSGTASSPGDFELASGTLNWADGDDVPKPITVTVHQDSDVEGPETVEISLDSPGGGATLGIPATMTLTILDDDTPSAHLTLVKSVDNTGGGTALATAWTLSASGPSSISGSTGSPAVTNATVVPGTYGLAESGGPANYSAGAWSCTAGTLTGSSLVLADGDSASCTITNTFVPPSGGACSATDSTTTVERISPPASLKLNKLTSNTCVRFFDERQDVTLQKALKVDISRPGRYELRRSLNPSSKIAVGTSVDSHILHADNVGTTNVRLQGSVTLDAAIIGVIVTDGSLDKSDLLGSPGTKYPNGLDHRGLEFAGLSNGGDIVLLSADRRTLTFNIRFGSVLDEIRVITANPPRAPSISDVRVHERAGRGGSGSDALPAEPRAQEIARRRPAS